MSAQTLDGRRLATELRAQVTRRAAAFKAQCGRAPSLVSLMIGDDGASLSYARSKARLAERSGISFTLERLAADTDTNQVVDALRAVQTDPGVDAVMVEMPLPRGIDISQVQRAVDPARDADGVSPFSLGLLTAGLQGPRPATPLAVMALLDDAGVSLAGALAVVVGRSRTVGLPVALLLLARDATVTVTHSRTPDLTGLTTGADVLIVAAGRPGLIGPAAVRQGATVIDVGTTWLSEPDHAQGGRLVGDVDPRVADIVGALSPVPGGVGPVTTAILLRTTVELAEARGAASGASATSAGSATSAETDA